MRIFNPDTAVSYYIFCFASLELLLRQFCKNFEKYRFLAYPLKFLRLFCGYFQIFEPFCGYFAAIFGSNLALISKNGNQLSGHKKSGTPFIYWRFPLFEGRVPGGTRTHDIQNHKHFYGLLGNPFVHRSFRSRVLNLMYPAYG